MLAPLTLALACLAPQDNAPPAPAPATAPAAAPVAAPNVKAKRDGKEAKDGKAAAKSTKPASGKPLVIPTPRIKPPEIPSYRIAVYLPGNRRFTGVVMRDRLFNDLVRADAQRTTEVYERPDQFVLRFADGVDGDVTFAWNQVVKVEVREILDAAGLKTIEEEYHRLMILKQQRAAEEAAKAEENAKATGDAKDGEKPKDAEKKEERAPLLVEFPPEQGWSTKRKEQIEWRRTVVGAAPDATEARFLEVYADWLVAFDAWTAAQAAKPAAKPGDAPEAKDGAKDGAPKSDGAKDEAKKEDAKKDEAKPASGGKEPAPEAKKDEVAPKNNGR